MNSKVNPPTEARATLNPWVALEQLNKWIQVDPMQRSMLLPWLTERLDALIPEARAALLENLRAVVEGRPIDQKTVPMER